MLYAANPKSMDVTLGAAYKLFPDSAAAKGQKEQAGPADPEGGTDDDDDGLTRSGRAFAQMLRGCTGRVDCRWSSSGSSEPLSNGMSPSPACSSSCSV
jgi:hypothetical protein